MKTSTQTVGVPSLLPTVCAAAPPFGLEDAQGPATLQLAERGSPYRARQRIVTTRDRGGHAVALLPIEP
jgi:hypothetical protein